MKHIDNETLEDIGYEVGILFNFINDNISNFIEKYFY